MVCIRLRLGGAERHFRREKPEEAVSREEFALILYRYAQYRGSSMLSGNDLSSFTDASAVSDAALPAVQWAVSEAILRGVTSISTRKAERPEPKLPRCSIGSLPGKFPGTRVRTKSSGIFRMFVWVKCPEFA